jgi:hypothetical protein
MEDFFICRNGGIPQRGPVGRTRDTYQMNEFYDIFKLESPRSFLMAKRSFHPSGDFRKCSRRIASVLVLKVSK